MEKLSRTSFGDLGLSSDGRPACRPTMDETDRRKRELEQDVLGPTPVTEEGRSRSTLAVMESLNFQACKDRTMAKFSGASCGTRYRPQPLTYRPGYPLRHTHAHTNKITIPRRCFGALRVRNGRKRPNRL